MKFEKQTLVLFANSFPYGKGETYLETEVEYYHVFDRVYIVSLNVKKDEIFSRRNINKDIKVIPIRRTSHLRYLIGVFFVLSDLNLYKEFMRLIKSRRFCFANIVELFVFFSRAHYEAKCVCRELREKINDNSVLYSYRFDYQPYTALLVKKNLGLKAKVVSRAHRYDLYESEKKHGYIPMREEILKNVSSVFVCSDHGTSYLRKLYPKYKDRIFTELLGTADFGEKEYEERDCFELVSCSNIVPVKRLELVVEGLSLIKDVPIKWTHYGDGDCAETIKKLAKERLKNNIRYDFRGNVENKEIMSEYKKRNYFLFLNTSKSEGLPVSIMEAISYGIPCIVTDVGGSSEIIHNGINGTLLRADVSANDLAEEIIRYCKMEKEEYIQYRKHARKLWDEKFNAEKNYKNFINRLNVCNNSNPI